MILTVFDIRILYVYGVDHVNIYVTHIHCHKEIDALHAHVAIFEGRSYIQCIRIPERRQSGRNERKAPLGLAFVQH